MFIRTEMLCKFLSRKRILPRIYRFRLTCIGIHQSVSHFVGRVTQHNRQPVSGLCDTLQTDGKTISAQDRKYQANMFTPEFFPYIGGNLVGRSIIALRPCHNGLRYGENIPIMNGKPLGLCRRQEGIYRYCSNIVSGMYNGCYQPPRNRSNLLRHIFLPLILIGWQPFRPSPCLDIILRTNAATNRR